MLVNDSKVHTQADHQHPPYHGYFAQMSGAAAMAHQPCTLCMENHRLAVPPPPPLCARTLLLWSSPFNLVAQLRLYGQCRRRQVGSQPVWCRPCWACLGVPLCVPQPVLSFTLTRTKLAAPAPPGESVASAGPVPPPAPAHTHTHTTSCLQTATVSHIITPTKLNDLPMKRTLQMQISRHR